MGPQGQYSCSPTLWWFLIQLWQQEKHSVVKMLVSLGWHIKPFITPSLFLSLPLPALPLLQLSVAQHTHRTLKSPFLLSMRSYTPSGSPSFKYEQIMALWMMLTVSLTGTLCVLYPHLTVSKPNGTHKKKKKQTNIQSLPRLVGGSRWMDVERQ